MRLMNNRRRDCTDVRRKIEKCGKLKGKQRRNLPAKRNLNASEYWCLCCLSLCACAEAKCERISFMVYTVHRTRTQKLCHTKMLISGCSDLYSICNFLLLAGSATYITLHFVPLFVQRYSCSRSSLFFFAFNDFVRSDSNATMTSARDNF